MKGFVNEKKIVPAAYDWLMDWSAILINFC